MKPTEKITYCEHCGEIIKLVSPPSDEQYEKGQIEIMSGTVLLPNWVVEDNGNNSHAKSIDGYYCGFHCLYAHLKDILHII